MQPDETRPPSIWPDALRMLGATVGMVLAIALVLLMLWDWAMGTGLRQSATVPPQLPVAQQMLAMLTCFAASVLLGMGRGVNRRLSVLLFVLAGALALWSSYVETPGGSIFWSSYVGQWRVPHLYIAGGCFGLAALAFWLRNRP